MADLEDRVRNRMLESISALGRPLVHTKLARYLLVEYVTILTKEIGFGKVFKIEDLNRILDDEKISVTLEAKCFDEDFSYQDIALARQHAEKKTGLLRKAISYHGGRKGSIYQLPHDETELIKLQRWYIETPVRDMKKSRKPLYKTKKSPGRLSINADLPDMMPFPSKIRYMDLIDFRQKLESRIKELMPIEYETLKSALVQEFPRTLLIYSLPDVLLTLGHKRMVSHLPHPHGLYLDESLRESK